MTNKGYGIGYVVSRNLHRRQLTASQRAMAAEKARKMFDQQTKERQRASGGNKKAVKETFPEPHAGQSRDQVGKAFGVSGKLVDQARTVREHGVPELARG